MKTYRILISKPGGRYGQLPSESYFLDLSGKKAQRYITREEAERDAARLTAKAIACKHCPAQYRPTYKVV